jgi:hypothetical protein
MEKSGKGTVQIEQTRIHEQINNNFTKNEVLTAYRTKPCRIEVEE